MADLMTWLEGTALGHVMRSSGVWAYGVVNLIHILGVASLFGSVLVLDLRLLGAWRSIPLVAISRPVVTIAGTGFVVAVFSGACLIVTNATEYIGNPFLLVKFPAIAIGLANVVVLRRLGAWKAHATRDLTRQEQRHLAAAGAVSLCAWLTALSAGRMIGYW
jgi:hypothetical protein